MIMPRLSFTLAVVTLMSAFALAAAVAAPNPCTCNWGECGHGYHCETGGCQVGDTAKIGKCKKIGGGAGNKPSLDLPYAVPGAQPRGTTGEKSKLKVAPRPQSKTP